VSKTWGRTKHHVKMHFFSASFPHEFTRCTVLIIGARMNLDDMDVTERVGVFRDIRRAVASALTHRCPVRGLHFVSMGLVGNPQKCI
jgi:hypothetical protein